MAVHETDLWLYLISLLTLLLSLALRPHLVTRGSGTGSNMGRTLLSRALLGAVVAALSLGEASAAVGRHQWPLPLPRQRLSSTSVVTGGRRLTRIRGGATEEWVCNGDVCELKPKAAGAANDAVSRRKAKRGKRGAGASDAEAAEPLSAAPGFLKVLQAYFKGGWPVARRARLPSPSTPPPFCTASVRREEPRQRNGSAAAIAGPAPGRRVGREWAACERG